MIFEECVKYKNVKVENVVNDNQWPLIICPLTLIKNAILLGFNEKRGKECLW